jgi:hypothetical protein
MRLIPLNIHEMCYFILLNKNFKGFIMLHIISNTCIYMNLLFSPLLQDNIHSRVSTFSINIYNYIYLCGPIWCFDACINCIFIKSEQLEAMIMLSTFFKIMEIKYKKHGKSTWILLNISEFFRFGIKHIPCIR